MILIWELSCILFKCGSYLIYVKASILFALQKSLCTGEKVSLLNSVALTKLRTFVCLQMFAYHINSFTRCVIVIRSVTSTLENYDKPCGRGTSEFVGEYQKAFVHPSSELTDEQQREKYIGRKDNCEGVNVAARLSFDPTNSSMRGKQGSRCCSNRNYENENPRTRFCFRNPTENV